MGGGGGGKGGSPAPQVVYVTRPAPQPVQQSRPVQQAPVYTPPPPPKEVTVTDYRDDGTGNYVPYQKKVLADEADYYTNRQLITDYRATDSGYESFNRPVEKGQVAASDKTLVTDYKQMRSGKYVPYTRPVLKTEASKYEAAPEDGADQQGVVAAEDTRRAIAPGDEEDTLLTVAQSNLKKTLG